MKKYESLGIFFRIFFGPDWGDTYQEIVDSYVDYQDGLDEIIDEIDDFLKNYPDNNSANPVLELLCEGSMAFLQPTPVEFLAWLSDYLKQKRDQ